MALSPVLFVWLLVLLVATTKTLQKAGVSRGHKTKQVGTNFVNFFVHNTKNSTKLECLLGYAEKTY